ncbi:flagellar export protein FliJ [Geotalea uraniireducens]|uniref:Flagellar FliJ protein n=1 Tax=Geotalea uraniireducens (strain Rf4) TaxID=351605 RepID=A5G984_GEOUR|nr:flagellar export protein FliJ [Geotalea uraniireducens]ABQ28352.1 flagellar export protein FliJ [Geotalea uraniireducens Rf4]
MAKKGFELDQVLNFRMEVEKMRKIDFATAKQEFEGANEQLMKEEEAMSHLIHEFADKQKDGISAAELLLYADFSRKKTVDIREHRQAVISLERKMTEKRETLLDAAKDKKVLEAFKDRKIRAYNQGIAEKERHFLDEISIQKTGHGKR